MGYAGQQVAGYRIDEELGRGGMGAVLGATHLASGRRVALKLMLALGDPDARARFAREVEALRAVRHDGVVALLDAGSHGGVPFIAMERLEGGSLRDLLRAGPLPPARAASLVAEVARAVHAAHEAGLVHRDLKPPNILFDRDGRPKVADFGLARILFAERLTQTGTILGTPHYLAPEQLEGGGKVDRRADVYALGVILHEALVGEPPYARFVPPGLWERVAHGPVPSPREQRPDVPPALDAVCRRALAKAPSERPSTALELAQELEAALAAGSHRRRRAALVAGALVVIGAGAFMALAAPRREPHAPPVATTGDGVATHAPAPATDDGSPPADVEPPPDEPAVDAAADDRLRRARALVDRAAARGSDEDVEGQRSDLREAADLLRDAHGPEARRLLAEVLGRLGQPAQGARTLLDGLPPGDERLGEEHRDVLREAFVRALEASPSATTSSFFAPPAADVDVASSPDELLEAIARRAPIDLAARARIALARALHARGAAPEAVRAQLDAAVDVSRRAPAPLLARAEWHAARNDAQAASADLAASGEPDPAPSESASGRLTAYVGALKALADGKRGEAVRALERVAVGEDPVGQAARERLRELGHPPPPPPPQPRRGPLPPLPRTPDSSPWGPFRAALEALPVDPAERDAHLERVLDEARRAYPQIMRASFFQAPGSAGFGGEEAEEVARLIAQRTRPGTPVRARARLALARALHACGAPPDRVRAALDEAVGEPSERGSSLVMRAEWLSARGELEAAAADLKEAEDHLPAAGELQARAACVRTFVAARQAHARGDLGEARALYEAVVREAHGKDPALAKRAAELRRELDED